MNSDCSFGPLKLIFTCICVYESVCPGGSVTGAVFNPALAFSTQFSCSGNSFLEYCLVYWLGPMLGKNH